MTKARDDVFGAGKTWGQIEQKAAEWVTRIDLRGTPENWTALDAWLAASPRHRAAFLRLSAAWRRADGLRKLAPLTGVVDEDMLDAARWKSDPSDDEPLEGSSISLQALPQSDSRGAECASEPLPRPELRVVALARSFLRTGSRLAAAVALITVLAGAGFGAWCAFERSKVDIYSTHVGEFRRVALADGSTIELNTNSEVRVHYTAAERHVDLTRGEALFHVSKNPTRPFDVHAGNTTVLAVGTAFSVHLRDSQKEDRVDVIVSEGRVAINPPSSQTYSAGTVAIVRNGRIEATTLPDEDISGRLSWTAGRLVFRGEKLGDVVAEINRYNQRKLVVSDPAISGLRVGGKFQATDPEGFARALDLMFGVKSHPVPRTFGPDAIRLDSGAP